MVNNPEIYRKVLDVLSLGIVPGFLLTTGFMVIGYGIKSLIRLFHRK